MERILDPVCYTGPTRTAHSCAFAPFSSSVVQRERRPPLRPKIGDRVLIVEKQHQASRDTIEGVVVQILTKTPTHPQGLKVRLATGQIGWVRAILPIASQAS